MSRARLLIATVICISPTILLFDSLIAQGFVAGVVAVELTIVACTLRPVETEYLISVIRPWLIVAAIPGLWMLVQVIPLPFFAHPFWTSAENALGRPILGTLSVDPGASIIAFGQYLSMTALVFASTAVAIDRQRARSITFALSATVAAIGLIMIVYRLFIGIFEPSSSIGAVATACEAIGVIVAAAACVWMFERRDLRRLAPKQPILSQLGIIAAGPVTLIICSCTLAFAATPGVTFASVCGLAVFAGMMLIRRLRLGPISITVMFIIGLSLGGLFILSHSAVPGKRLPLVFAASPSALTERVLNDAPLAGTGAGTFASVAPIYREMDDPAPDQAASTTAATLAIVLGLPMLWLVTVMTSALSLFLLRASLRRGRDAHYPAMGGSCLIALLLIAFVNAGPLGAATSLITAVALGVALAQSRNRKVNPS